MYAQMVIEEELKELKELNDDLQQKLTSAEEKCDNAVESHSKEIAKSNEKVLTFFRWNFYSVILHPIHHSALIWSSG